MRLRQRFGDLIDLGPLVACLHVIAQHLQARGIQLRIDQHLFSYHHASCDRADRIGHLVVRGQHKLRVKRRGHRPQKQPGRCADTDDRDIEAKLGRKMWVKMIQAVVQKPRTDTLLPLGIDGAGWWELLIRQEGHDRIHRHLRDAFPDAPADLCRLPLSRNRGVHVMAEYLERQFCDFGIPERVAAFHMHQVGGRQTGLTNDLLAYQLGHVNLADVEHIQVLEDLRHRQRAISQQSDEGFFLAALEQAGRRLAQ